MIIMYMNMQCIIIVIKTIVHQNHIHKIVHSAMYYQTVIHERIVKSY